MHGWRWRQGLHSERVIGWQAFNQASEEREEYRFVFLTSGLELHFIVFLISTLRLCFEQ